VDERHFLMNSILISRLEKRLQPQKAVAKVGGPLLCIFESI
jgi:hypothetical protein